MNKWFMRVTSLIVAIGLLTGCANDDGDDQGTANNNQTGETENNSNSEEINEDSVVITISIDEGTEYIDEKEIPIEDGAILMDVLKENFFVEEEGGFINSIERVAPGEGEDKAWTFFVNGEMAPKGANETELSSGDEVTFDLQAWE